MRNLIVLLIVFTVFSSCKTRQVNKDLNFRISKSELQDKIKGGWAGQTIGVTYGWPSEFLYQGTYIQDYEEIKWHDDYVNEAMTKFPGLYDDVYMDLTFVEVFERLGLDAPLDSFAKPYANSEFELWHANQAGRYNIQQGMSPEVSGHWLNNPHADDIDFQIEADFAGLMSPGMPQVANTIAEKIGKMMNSGDGWYGGVYVANMYTLAFINSDIKYIVKEALKAIPKESDFYKCLSDVITWHDKYPSNWKQTWFEIQKKWAEEVGCPNMVYHPLNIDAKLNSAYVVLGLLYGDGDFTKTMEVSTRAGQDSDCNPSTAGGILGTMIGYSNIPDFWLNPLKKAEHRNFSHTNLSLKKVYKIGFEHAVKNVVSNGGNDDDDDYVVIETQEPKVVAFEKNFQGHYPKEKVSLYQAFSDSLTYTLEGVGFVLSGGARKSQGISDNHILEAALIIDGEEVERAKFPISTNKRRTDMFWRYQLNKQKHNVKVKVINPKEGFEFIVTDVLVYDDVPKAGIREQ